MLSCFPDPYPDELLYSVCARYGHHLQFSNRRNVAQDVFGKVMTASIDFPGHLDALIANLPSGHLYTVDQIIDGHTMLPLYRPFLEETRYGRLRISMFNSRDNVHLRIGVAASRIRNPLWLRFCPRCIETDRTEFGECYWHRVHHIPGVEVCPIHQVMLENSTAPTPCRGKQAVFYAAEEVVQPGPLRPVDTGNVRYEKLYAIATNIDWLLKYRGPVPTVETLGLRYRSLLADQNLGTHTRISRMQPLLRAFRHYYPYDLLEQLGCELDDRANNNWLIRLTRNGIYTQHPLSQRVSL